MRKGIILAGGSGTRLYPLTKVVSKQLMPVYDKPMVYYPLATLMQAQLQEILIISTPHEIDRYRDLLGNGSNFGIKLSYIIQPSPDGLAQAFVLAKDFLDGCPAALILGDNLFYGHNWSDSLKAVNEKSGSTIFGYHVANPSAYGVAEFNSKGEVVSVEEKPKEPKSNYAIPGLYFFDADVVDVAKQLKPSARGELEITGVIDYYLKTRNLNIEIMGRGMAWLDTGTHDDLLAAAQFIETIEKRQGLKINCPEEVAYRNGWLSDEEICKIAEPLIKSGYGKYLLSLVNKREF
ncbi:MAG: glucose-1-phosphate thymidylyltransferase [Rhodobiaceae bacterium]|nr:glucose-1-phosphate thymidylyltransferase [Rhodobiaceae bacterium]|tara:strand:- start:8024 stop:8899 length:876 start_codon:yes stop_codon:yes gene_type:complete